MNKKIEIVEKEIKNTVKGITQKISNQFDIKDKEIIKQLEEYIEERLRVDLLKEIDEYIKEIITNMERE